VRIKHILVFQARTTLSSGFIAFRSTSIVYAHILSLKVAALMIESVT
jgi:hypothetical protein